MSPGQTFELEEFFMTDAELKASAEAFVNEHWEEIIEDIRYLVQVESVEDLSLAEPGKPWGPKGLMRHFAAALRLQSAWVLRLQT